MAGPLGVVPNSQAYSHSHISQTQNLFFLVFFFFHSQPPMGSAGSPPRWYHSAPATQYKLVCTSNSCFTIFIWWRVVWYPRQLWLAPVQLFADDSHNASLFFFLCYDLHNTHLWPKVWQNISYLLLNTAPFCSHYWLLPLYLSPAGRGYTVL